jgi:hypothetical protein
MHERMILPWSKSDLCELTIAKLQTDPGDGLAWNKQQRACHIIECLRGTTTIKICPLTIDLLRYSLSTYHG